MQPAAVPIRAVRRMAARSCPRSQRQRVRFGFGEMMGPCMVVLAVYAGFPARAAP